MREGEFKQADMQAIIKEAEASKDINALCKKHGITVAKLREWQQKASQDSPVERDRFIVAGGHKPNTISDFYNQNLHHFQHVSVDYD